MNRFKVITRKQANSMLFETVNFANTYVVWDNKTSEWCVNAASKKDNQMICDEWNAEELSSLVLIKVGHLTLLKGGLAA